MKNVLVAMDSMKGCLSSYYASLYVAGGLEETHPDIKAVFLPVSDGGEGMVEMVANGLRSGDYCHCNVIGPLGEEIESKWYRYKNSAGWHASMEFAAAAGLTLIEENRRNPLHASSYGVGQMINDALKSGIYDIMLGLGGSATVDAGLGALQAMGLRLIDTEGNILPRPFTGRRLSEVADIEFTGPFKERIAKLKLTLLCDVDAPFTGAHGAPRVFGPQKGADEEEVKILEEGMEHVRKLIIEKTGIDLNQVPGSGAAGGAGGGLFALAGAHIQKGASTLLDIIGFDNELAGIDLIITGEGSSDRQTLMGKIPFEILQRGKKRNIPVLLVAGRVSDHEELLEAGFHRLICINSPDIVWRSNTIGKDPLDPAVASDRLCSIFKAYDFT
ncbi:MAG: glycerate kinase [Muribaculaceae bacterium]|nr:glycerate kinase [Muribaculaceae bacterium]